MRPLHVAVVSALTVVLTLPVGAERTRNLQGEIPQVLYTSISKHDPAYPTFVAAAAAVNADGTINEKLIHPHAVDTLRGILDQDPVDGCIRTEEVWWDELEVPDRPSLDLAARRSHLVVVGTVIAREAGFRFFEAGQLIEVKVEEVIRGHAEDDRYFVFVPAATFQAGPYRICKIDRRYAAPPEIGERVVLLAPRAQDIGDSFIDLVDGSGLIVLEGKSRVRLPKNFSDGLQREDVDQQRVLSILREAGHRPSKEER